MSLTLSLAAVDVLAQLLGVDPRRYPLEIPSVGDRAEDRVRIARAVLADLGARGLVGEDGVDPRVERALRALAEAEVAVAVAGSPDSGDLVRARAAVRAGYAVIAVQEGQFLRFTPVGPDTLPRALVALLPRVPAGPGQSVRVGGSPPERPAGITEAVRAPRTAAQTQLRVAEEVLTRPRTGFGAFTVTHLATDTATLTWLDTDAGRYLGLARPDTDEITYSPADGPRLARQLADLMAR
ncbi:ESX secretion-associated protein EspG [Actinokineospora guangxiensis]|uniref:ESX secretion-associated protein EspG n=1 Tax=Actinokineospora guangxiensis TaxID=1490288 RepID=A0ABW0EEJ1_9PSEU